MPASMNIPLVDLRAQYATIRDEIDAAIEGVLETAAFILGEEVQRFEAAFAEHVQAAGAVGVASGTAAIELVLKAMDIGAGHEVIVPAHTFIATAEAVSNVGARPVFADIDENVFALDPAHVESLINARTRAIMPVHIYGHPAPMSELAAIASQRGVWLIEDAAQAHGAEVDGRRCGSIGNAACFSFYPGKNLGAYGDAGAVTSNDAELLARVRRLRDHGRTTKYEHEEIGQAARMDAIQAAVLNVKLTHLDAWTEARRRVASRYATLLEPASVRLPVEAAGAKHVYHLYAIRSNARDALLEHLRSQGVAAGIHYPVPLHRQPAYAGQGYESIALPVTESVAASILSLPIYPELTNEQIAHVANVVLEFAS
jgi:dTDP-4-amino-4,6-dideoxygalactose transaminase